MPIPAYKHTHTPHNCTQSYTHTHLSRFSLFHFDHLLAAAEVGQDCWIAFHQFHHHPRQSCLGQHWELVPAPQLLSIVLDVQFHLCLVLAAVVLCVAVTVIIAALRRLLLLRFQIFSCSLLPILCRGPATDNANPSGHLLFIICQVLWAVIFTTQPRKVPLDDRVCHTLQHFLLRLCQCAWDWFRRRHQGQLDGWDRIYTGVRTGVWKWAIQLAHLCHHLAEHVVVPPSCTGEPPHEVEELLALVSHWMDLLLKLEVWAVGHLDTIPLKDEPSHRSHLKDVADDQTCHGVKAFESTSSACPEHLLDAFVIYKDLRQVLPSCEAHQQTEVGMHALLVQGRWNQVRANSANI